MKLLYSLQLFILAILDLPAQSIEITRKTELSDTTHNNNYGYSAPRSKGTMVRVVGDNVSYVTSFAKRESPIETEILGLEQLECKTLLKRDTTTLKRLWTRDFTLDIPTDHVVVAKSTLPYYVSYGRIIENLLITDTVVYAKGIEFVSMLETNARLGDPIRRNYTNVWKRGFGGWKIIAKYMTETKK
jgi:hypothetical protein